MSMIKAIYTDALRQQHPCVLLDADYSDLKVKILLDGEVGVCSSWLVEEIDDEIYEIMTDPEIQEGLINASLDLVFAYIEMGDKEGAKHTLDEVMSQYDLNQVQLERANELLKLIKPKKG